MLHSALLVIAACLLSAPHLAAARPVELISGGTRVGIASWGADCGPRPADARSRPGARYTLMDDALVPVGRARPLFGPGICRAATGLRQLLEGRTGGGFDCQARADSPKQVTGRVDRQLDGDFITVRHRFEYAWGLDGSRCRLLVHGTWRLKASGDPSRPAVAPATVTPPAAPRTGTSTRCARPGPPARVVIDGPARRKATPGSSHALRARVTDAAGCRLRRPSRWTATAGAVDANGRFTAPLTGDARVDVQVGSATASVHFRIAQPDANLAAAPPTLTPGEVARAARRSAASVSGEVVPGEHESLPWLRIGFVLILLGAGATVFRLRRR